MCRKPLSPTGKKRVFVARKRATINEICPKQNIYHLFAQSVRVKTVGNAQGIPLRLLIDKIILSIAGRVAMGKKFITNSYKMTGISFFFLD
ncbi:MAG: hypothetical protein IJ129_02045 [Ruminococcus sp.]|nr:hypothetical protein [Ruminococcus sp.]